MNDTAQRELLQTFVRLADTLVDDYDVVDLLQVLVDACRDLLDTTAAGILLADSRGELEVVASTSEASLLVELMQLSAEAGPCIESFRSGRRIACPTSSTPTTRGCSSAAPRSLTASGPWTRFRFDSAT